MWCAVPRCLSGSKFWKPELTLKTTPPSVGLTLEMTLIYDSPVAFSGDVIGGMSLSSLESISYWSVGCAFHMSTQSWYTTFPEVNWKRRGSLWVFTPPLPCTGSFSHYTVVAKPERQIWVLSNYVDWCSTVCLGFAAISLRFVQGDPQKLTLFMELIYRLGEWTNTLS